MQIGTDLLLYKKNLNYFERKKRLLILSQVLKSKFVGQPKSFPRQLTLKESVLVYREYFGMWTSADFMGNCALSFNLVLIVQTKYLKTFTLNSYNEQQRKDSENN